MKATRPVLFLLAALAGSTFVSCGGGGGADSVKLNGAGASFPATIYVSWFKEFHGKHRDILVDYQSVGSGQGEKSFIDGTVDFGASDAPKVDKLMKVDRGAMLLPMTAGGVVLAYNLEGIADLKLSRKAYVDIFLGKVTRWNDPEILKHNPGVSLPDAPINPVVRADSSGTTYVFTNHLATVSPEFAANPGRAKMPNWPGSALTKSKGNEGVTASLRTTPGSIGYIEYGYAVHNKLAMASLENKSGQFVKPTIESTQASLAAVQMPENMVAWLPDPEGAASYPIVTFTWLILYRKYDDPKKLEALKKVINWCLGEGQTKSEALGYIPLPPAIVTKVKEALASIK